ncbi:zinc ribbon domain-containing protein [Methylomonas sp. DH-1]|uniref:zinc ribbon domain-containing protein n=1 Tax=Methylomonas sp. (strain DH-1) TaxID=1727196 RepID=UPI0007C95687|nr:zinc ribbon domain-containing protein [Methylomonas sp. DH-1]ANE54733.1 hypothetical protein AYM39_05740 [Methylomonas sp. DH-1]
MKHCPKCNREVAPAAAICPHCGIVFAKYYKYHADPQAPATPRPQATVVIAPAPDSLLGGDAYRDNSAVFLGRCLLLPGFVLWSWLLIAPGIAANAAGESFLHLVNLPFHEAGHVIFRPFGQFVASLGGTLGQLLMPTVCLLTLLLKTRDPFGAGLCLWWIGENFLDIAPYINDARAGQLPLLGGNFGHSAPYGFHDWEYLLTEFGLLAQDHRLANAAQLTGAVLMITALLYCGRVLWEQRRGLAASNQG